MRTQRIILLVIIVFTSNIILGQATDSLKNAMLEKIKSSEVFKETIYEFKGKELPKFELPLLSGKKINSESLKGKPTIINFWFSNCAPCIEEMPLLNEIKSEFGNEVNFISMTFQNQNEVNEFLRTHDFDFTHIVDSKDYIKTFGTFGYPKTLILDKDLVIVEIEKMIPKDTENEEKNKAEFKAQLSEKLNELKKR
ncbi:TlpA family protein disulfide reductase [Winogradskyella undariae]|uniref:TlpA family protein disulfide reductase n=1 Tax=Winogradskyella TaxID=286104 RepID=UPI00156ABD46|nr:MULTISPECIES: TlpA disulfide reductase family protein [Winogradskyella]NRR92564.1 TlpA family protein disulfide reductase [Winogradskyella undariae]QXP79009.1 TlpA family protein disulfide reductase [Winogradskyella sp. HaHa_3_26]